jgi:hypothetical protein
LRNRSSYGPYDVFGSQLSKNIIRTIRVTIPQLRNMWKNEHLTSFSDLLHSKCKCILFFTENSFNLQCLKVQLLNFTEKSSSSVRFNRFHRVYSFTSTLYCFRFLSFALYSDTRILLYARRIYKKKYL